MTKKSLYEFCQKHLRLCGCGAPDNVVDLIRKVLIGFKKEPYDNVAVVLPGVYGSPDNYAEWFLLYRLDDIGLLEHGGNIRGSWLTQLGKDMVEAMETYPDWQPIMAGHIAFTKDEATGEYTIAEVFHSDTNTTTPIENWNG